MPTLAIIGCALGALWLLANAKKSRPDGTFVKNLHPYRQIMQYVMPTRTESAVYLNVDLRIERLEAYLEKAKGAFGANVTHCIVAAVYVALARMPALNRFVVGRRLYQRDGVWLSFSMKRKKKNQEAKLAVVKLRMQEGEDFPSLVARINEQIVHERSGKKTYADKEYDLFNLLPRPVLRGAAAFLRWLDYYNLLPGSFIHPDSLYTSMVIANVGSLQLPAGYHHLYEWGNSPFFLMVGQIEDRAVIENGVAVAARILPLKLTFDERVEDGLTAGFGLRAFNDILGNPELTLGGLAEDGSDRHPIWPREREE